MNVMGQPMKYKQFVLLAILILMPITTTAQESYQHSVTLSKHPEWLQCQVDDECVIVPGRTCGYQFAANENFKEQATNPEYTMMDCLKSFTYRLGFSAKCINHECVIA
jgi:hypothetical protein